jgi:hypothetical protein
VLIFSGVEEAIQILQARYNSTVFRPRLLLLSKPAMGQGEVAAAVLHEIEELPVHCIDNASLCMCVLKTIQKYSVLI